MDDVHAEWSSRIAEIARFTLIFGDPLGSVLLLLALKKIPFLVFRFQKHFVYRKNTGVHPISIPTLILCPLICM